MGSTGSMMWVSASKMRYPARAIGVSSDHDAGIGVQQRQNAIPTLRGYPEDRALDTGRAQTLERHLLRLREEDRHGNRLRIAAGLLRSLPEQADLLRRVPAAAGERHPAVRELHDPIESRWAVAAHQDRWVRLCHGLRRLAGMFVCSGTQRDSKPRSSRARESSPGRMA